MTHKVNDREYESVRHLPVEGRYEHLIKRAADWSELWSLQSAEGWVVGADESGREFIPVWPHPRYAEASATGAWKGATPAPIEIHEWLETWTPELVTSARLIGVFPVDDGPSAVIDPQAFAADLEGELSLVE
ncbi:MAG TPA: DUF2750 domain-containing protein [Candidatus Limnocylindrales bacterium]|jgi:Protein of unknown function (DUF2750)|nr:DUF2750 domain-containing protein [Candidatus Limnocylindrales bacterium]